MEAKYMTREEYEELLKHEYAGPGLPLAPNAGGFWRLVMDDTGATCLETGLYVEGLSKHFAPSH